MCGRRKSGTIKDNHQKKSEVNYQKRDSLGCESQPQIKADLPSFGSDFPKGYEACKNKHLAQANSH